MFPITIGSFLVSASNNRRGDALSLCIFGSLEKPLPSYVASQLKKVMRGGQVSG